MINNIIPFPCKAKRDAMRLFKEYDKHFPATYSRPPIKASIEDLKNRQIRKSLNFMFEYGVKKE